jgi:hypothetical protein
MPISGEASPTRASMNCESVVLLQLEQSGHADLGRGFADTREHEL